MSTEQRTPPTLRPHFSPSAFLRLRGRERQEVLNKWLSKSLTQSAASRLCQSATPLKKKERPFTFCPSPNFGCITCSFPLPKSIKLSADRSATLSEVLLGSFFIRICKRNTRRQGFLSSATFHANDICLYRSSRIFICELN